MPPSLSTVFHRRRSCRRRRHCRPPLSNAPATAAVVVHGTVLQWIACRHLSPSQRLAVDCYFYLLILLSSCWPVILDGHFRWSFVTVIFGHPLFTYIHFDTNSTRTHWGRQLQIQYWPGRHRIGGQKGGIFEPPPRNVAFEVSRKFKIMY